MTKKTIPTPEDLRNLLRYEPETGKLFWRERNDVGPQWNARFADKEAFTNTMGSGYRNGSINYKGFYAHRVAWAIHFGSWPEHEIDHINHDKTDNRISNLREVSSVENKRNLPSNRLKKSRTLGVTRCKVTNKWLARIGVDGVSITIGRYRCLSAAILARKSAEVKYGFHKNHGSSPALKS